MNEALVRRMRDALKGRRGITEKKMFGGVCFLLRGNMLCAAGKDHFMFRVGKEQDAKALARPGARVMSMGGRKFPGYMWVDTACDARALKRWIDTARVHVAALPPKAKISGRD